MGAIANCKTCHKVYNILGLQQRIGAPSPWTQEYCSEGCRNKRLAIEEAVARRNETILSCYNCGGTDRLCMIPCNSEAGLTGFIITCTGCESTVVNKNIKLIDRKGK
jgi:hypothetical protein